MPALTANKVTTYANNIAEVLWSDRNTLDAFKLAVEVVDTDYTQAGAYPGYRQDPSFHRRCQSGSEGEG